MSSRWSPLWLAGVLVLAAAAPVYLQAAHAPPNSDSVVHFLQLKSMWRGNIFLSGWRLPEDNFYFTDLPFYLGIAAIAGPTSALVYMVPTVVYLAVLATALLLIVSNVERPGEAWIAVPAGFFFLAMPAAAWPVLDSGCHTACMLFGLAQIALVAPILRGRTPTPRRLAAFILLLTAMTASDPFGLFAVAIPIGIFFVAGILFDAGRRRIFLRLLAVTVGAAAAGSLIPNAIEFAGGFQTTWPIHVGPVPWQLLGANLLGVVRALAKLGGIRALGWNEPWRVEDGVRSIAALAVIVSCVAAMTRVTRFTTRPSLMLILCAVFLLAASTVSRQFHNTLGSAERYLVPVFVFAGVAAAMELPRLLGSMRSGSIRRAVLL
ncbi:MAG: hypothetical protein ACREFC_09725, partial [Stellaceae bacterium]